VLLVGAKAHRLSKVSKDAATAGQKIACPNAAKPAKLEILKHGSLEGPVSPLSPGLFYSSLRRVLEVTGNRSYRYLAIRPGGCNLRGCSQTTRRYALQAPWMNCSCTGHARRRY
jgi:hypothetical protein